MKQWFTGCLVVFAIWVIVSLLLLVWGAPAVFITDLALSTYKWREQKCDHRYWFERGPISGNWFCK